MTPGTIPNRDSNPQNQPNPNDAVSYVDGAAASIGGRAGASVLYEATSEFSIFFESLFS
jgi:hypothetical protein